MLAATSLTASQILLIGVVLSALVAALSAAVGTAWRRHRWTSQTRRVDRELREAPRIAMPGLEPTPGRADPTPPPAPPAGEVPAAGPSTPPAAARPLSAPQAPRPKHVAPRPKQGPSVPRAERAAKDADAPAGLPRPATPPAPAQADAPPPYAGQSWAEQDDGWSPPEPVRRSLFRRRRP